MKEFPADTPVDVYVPLFEDHKTMELVGFGRVYKYTTENGIRYVWVKMVGDRDGLEFRKVETVDVMPHSIKNPDTFKQMDA